MARSRRERRELEGRDVLAKESSASRDGLFQSDQVESAEPYPEDKEGKFHDRRVQNRPRYDEPVYAEPSYHQKSKRRRGCGCGCGCWSWLIFILLLIVLGIAAKAFYDVQSSVNVMNEDSDYAQMREVDLPVFKPSNTLTFLLMGIDSSDSGSVESGRSDTMVLMTANPKTKQSYMLSIPRDSYVEIPGYGMDKINHAYAFGGAPLSVETVQNFLGVPVDYYVAVDMQGLEELVNAMGGVTVTPQMSFSQDGYQFESGVAQQMNGAGALAYSRNRKDDPAGDYGRQDRQRQVLAAMKDKLLSLDGIVHYPQLLAAMENHVVTNANVFDILKGVLGYRSALNSIENHQLLGQGQMINGVYYEMIPEDQVIQARSLLQEEINN